MEMPLLSCYNVFEQKINTDTGLVIALHIHYFHKKSEVLS